MLPTVPRTPSLHLDGRRALGTGAGRGFAKRQALRASRASAGEEDVIGAVPFPAGDAAALVTGSALMVDGGWTAA